MVQIRYVFVVQQIPILYDPASNSKRSNLCIVYVIYV